ncbi:MAG: hypothetical protein CBD98_003325 [Flavobacteriaceae bacterium TMED238]|nr:MAG: hypothetical protein CBD98_003325 [Flavobacteriaceae bacterium TMED238]
MTNQKSKNYFYFSSTLTLLFFLPIFYNSNIGSDWDSYALIGTYENFIKNGIYIPSRPPGFPIYELLISLCIVIGEGLGINFERIILLFQFSLLISFNFLIYSFFKKTKNSNWLIYLIISLSPIYLISGLSAIDYIFGNLFGFLAIFLTMYLYEQKYSKFFIVLSLALSVSARLSNLIFLLVVILCIYSKEKDFKQCIILMISSLVITTIIYAIFYHNLFSFYVSSGVYSDWSDMFCVLNLTNTDHDLVNRLGRFVLKQIPFLGGLGLLIVISIFFKLKFDIKGNNFYLFLIFLFFELSFLRLPTEEGHLLPAFISFMLIINKSKNKLISVLLLCVVLSNFVDLKFYEVDKINSATEIYFSLDFKTGLFIEDYLLRNEIAEDKSFHYKNSQITLYDAWSKGCPNR